MSDPPPLANVKSFFDDYFKNVKGRRVLDAAAPSIALDYSRQLQAAVERMCNARTAGAPSGATPEVPRQPNATPKIDNLTRPAANTSHSNFVEDDS